MSDELRLLAERIAQELAARDAIRTSGVRPREDSSRATESIATASSQAPKSGNGHHPPRGVSFAQKEARIADYIDHTLLKAEATTTEVDRLCDEARENHFAAVCVNPCWVERCRGRLKGSDVGVATVIGFPLGASRSETKAFEAQLAVRQGATELDMVAAVGHIKSGEWSYVYDDIAAVVQGAAGTLVKVIIESAALTPVEIVKASALAKEAGAQYVKTSTGFHPAGGASAEAVALMRLVVGDSLGVKASGGVRDCPTALRMIASGATRIGTSSGVAMTQCLGQGPLPVKDLLSLADRHAARCVSGACEAAGSGASGSY